MTSDKKLVIKLKKGNLKCLQVERESTQGSINLETGAQASLEKAGCSHWLMKDFAGLAGQS